MARKKTLVVNGNCLTVVRRGCGNGGGFREVVSVERWRQGAIPHANGLSTIVVKRFDANCDERSKQVKVEFEALYEFEHKNIIRLAGYCDKVNEKIIIYEHASSGRLSEHLKDTSLTWLKRLKICIDVATGLEFLHEGGIKGEEEWWNFWRVEEVTLELDETYASESFSYIDPRCIKEEVT
nr:protein kinase-like domain, phloem protein 2-like protein [Tanacetum cinerariifolium]